MPAKTTTVAFKMPVHASDGLNWRIMGEWASTDWNHARLPFATFTLRNQSGEILKGGVQIIASMSHTHSQDLWSSSSLHIIFIVQVPFHCKTFLICLLCPLLIPSFPPSTFKFPTGSFFYLTTLLSLPCSELCLIKFSTLAYHRKQKKEKGKNSGWP